MFDIIVVFWDWMIIFNIAIVIVFWDDIITLVICVDCVIIYIGWVVVWAGWLVNTYIGYVVAVSIRPQDCWYVSYYPNCAGW